MKQREVLKNKVNHPGWKLLNKEEKHEGCDPRGIQTTCTQSLYSCRHRNCNAVVLMEERFSGGKFLDLLMNISRAQHTEHKGRSTSELLDFVGSIGNLRFIFKIK